jgi:hypothetical protein
MCLHREHRAACPADRLVQPAMPRKHNCKRSNWRNQKLVLISMRDWKVKTKTAEGVKIHSGGSTNIYSSTQYSLIRTHVVVRILYSASEKESWANVPVASQGMETDCNSWIYLLHSIENSEEVHERRRRIPNKSHLLAFYSNVSQETPLTHSSFESLSVKRPLCHASHRHSLQERMIRLQLSVMVSCY